MDGINYICIRSKDINYILEYLDIEGIEIYINRQGKNQFEEIFVSYEFLYNDNKGQALLSEIKKTSDYSLKCYCNGMSDGSGINMCIAYYPGQNLKYRLRTNIVNKNKHSELCKKCRLSAVIVEDEEMNIFDDKKYPDVSYVENALGNGNIQKKFQLKLGCNKLDYSNTLRGETNESTNSVQERNKRIEHDRMAHVRTMGEDILISANNGYCLVKNSIGDIKQILKELYLIWDKDSTSWTQKKRIFNDLKCGINNKEHIHPRDSIIFQLKTSDKVECELWLTEIMFLPRKIKKGINPEEKSECNKTESLINYINNLKKSTYENYDNDTENHILLRNRINFKKDDYNKIVNNLILKKGVYILLELLRIEDAEEEVYKQLNIGYKRKKKYKKVVLSASHNATLETSSDREIYIYITESQFNLSRFRESKFSKGKTYDGKNEAYMFSAFVRLNEMDNNIIISNEFSFIPIYPKYALPIDSNLESKFIEKILYINKKIECKSDKIIFSKVSSISEDKRLYGGYIPDFILYTKNTKHIKEDHVVTEVYGMSTKEYYKHMYIKNTKYIEESLCEKYKYLPYFCNLESIKVNIDNQLMDISNNKFVTDFKMNLRNILIEEKKLDDEDFN